MRNHMKKLGLLWKTTQVQGHRKGMIHGLPGDFHGPRRMPVLPETGETACFGFIGIDGIGVVISPTRVHHVIMGKNK